MVLQGLSHCCVHHQVAAIVCIKLEPPHLQHRREQAGDPAVVRVRVCLQSTCPVRGVACACNCE